MFRILAVSTWLVPVVITSITFVVLASILIVWILMTSYQLKTLKIKVDEANKNLDIALAKRFDLLSKMNETLKDYQITEKTTLESILKLSQPDFDASIKEKEEFASSISRGLETVIDLAIRYGDLQVDKVMTGLLEAIVDVEENLQASRKKYNSTVSYFNQKVQFFPSNLIAKKQGYVTISFFEIDKLKRDNALK